MKVLKGMILGAVMLGSTIGLNNYSNAQTPVAPTGKFYQKYHINRVFGVYSIEGDKQTYMSFNPIYSDTGKGDDKIIGVLETSASVSSNLPGIDAWDYDVTMRTYINEFGRPVKSISLRRNEGGRAQITNKKDLEELSKEGLLPNNGDKITGCAIEKYESIKGDTLNKKLTNISRDTTYLVPKKTFDFLSLIYHIICTPKNVNRRYYMKNMETQSDVTVAIREEEEDDQKVYEVTTTFPENVDLPIKSGWFKFIPGNAPFEMGAELKAIPLKPSAEKEDDN